MAIDYTRNDFEINGVIDTNKPVWKNIENIANSAGAWVTYDSTTGQYEAVVNKAGTSSHSFTDTNIIGAIKVSGTGLDQLYNKCYVSFPLTDVKDSSDTLRISAPSAILKDDEPDNQMNLTYPLVNNPVQAAKLGLLELKQGRVDLIVEFTTDFHQSDVKAGELIDITNDIFAWTNKVFRVLQIKEVDNGKDLLYQITALEYDSDVYTFDVGQSSASQPDYYSIADEDGINTIGELAQCVTPTVTRTEQVSRPNFLVETTVPNQPGIVEGVEVWYYKIPDSELPSWDTVDDAARTYNKIFTIRPTGNQKVFPPNQDVSHDIDTLDAGNYLFKVRAVNSVTSGPFSDVMGSYEAYNPQQTTDRIDNNTEVDEGSGNILTTLGVAGLIGYLNSLMRDNSAASGGIFDKIFDIFNTESGVDIRGTDQVQLLSQAGNTMIIANTGKTTVSGLAQATTQTNMYTSSTWSPAYSGTYKFDSIIDQNSSGARGRDDFDINPSTNVNLLDGAGNPYPDPVNGGYYNVQIPTMNWGGFDAIVVSHLIYDVTAGSTVSGSYAVSGGKGAYSWTDFSLSSVVTLDATHTYRTEFGYIQDTASNPSATASFDMSWNIYTTG